MESQNESEFIEEDESIEENEKKKRLLKIEVDEDFIDKNGKTVKRVFAGVFLFFFVLVGIFLIQEYRIGTFKDADSFRDYINSFGYFGPIILTFFQCFKVLYAIVPGFLGCIAGAALFGTVGGFICNYIGICAGSILAFLLSKKFGFSIMRMIFSEKKIRAQRRRMNKFTKHFHIFLWVAILIPISPDDFLCYFAGLTQMKIKKFVVIILTAKPLGILIYSLLFGNLFQ